MGREGVILRPSIIASDVWLVELDKAINLPWPFGPRKVVIRGESQLTVVSGV